MTSESVLEQSTVADGVSSTPAGPKAACLQAPEVSLGHTTSFSSHTDAGASFWCCRHLTCKARCNSSSRSETVIGQGLGCFKDCWTYMCMHAQRNR